MGIEVNWSNEAVERFDAIVQYLLEHWGDRELKQFLQQAETIIARLKTFPESYPPGKST